MPKQEYDSQRIYTVYCNLKVNVESISWCIANCDYYHFYLYLKKYCEWVYEHYELIKLNLFDFEDVLLFDLETSDINYWNNVNYNYKD